MRRRALSAASQVNGDLQIMEFDFDYCDNNSFSTYYSRIPDELSTSLVSLLNNNIGLAEYEEQAIYEVYTYSYELLKTLRVEIYFKSLLVKQIEILKQDDVWTEGVIILNGEYEVETRFGPVSMDSVFFRSDGEMFMEY